MFNNGQQTFIPELGRVNSVTSSSFLQFLGAYKKRKEGTRSGFAMFFLKTIYSTPEAVAAPHQIRANNQD